MSGKAQDLTGKKYNNLLVLYRIDDYVSQNGRKFVMWHCKCDCGNEVDVRAESLKSGNTKGCGCLKENGWHNRETHRLSKTRIYRIWQAMKSRCFNKNNSYFYNYGARGITVCDEWKNDFEKFYAWSMHNGYSEDLTIDRIDNNGNYEPVNCRWATRTVQMNNTRSNKKILYHGKEYTVSELSRISGINAGALNSRIRLGWDIEKALSEKVRGHT